MKDKEFAREYLGTFEPPSPAYQAAFDIWSDYFRTCEAFDRTVCTGPIGRDGGVLPASPTERALIEKNARVRHAFAAQRLAEAGVDDTTSRRAREDALRRAR